DPRHTGGDRQTGIARTLACWPGMTSVALERPTAPAVRARHFVLAVLALALGGVAVGTKEVVPMGLLPEIADGLGVSIPTAGHVISAYAVGVVVGAPGAGLL